MFIGSAFLLARIGTAVLISALPVLLIIGFKKLMPRVQEMIPWLYWS
jgi:hypothetical protein